MELLIPAAAVAGFRWLGQFCDHSWPAIQLRSMRERHALLVLSPGTPLLAVSALEALRVGNHLLGGRALEPLLLSPDGRDLQCAGGVTLAVDAALSDCRDLSGLYVVADRLPALDGSTGLSPVLLSLGRDLERRGGVIGGLGCGAAWWAETGLMNGYRCCLQSLHHAEAAQRWPEAIICTAHHVHDRSRWTSAAGLAGIELLIRWFGTRHGERVKLQLLAHFGIERLRQEHEHQAEAGSERAGSSARLAEALALMQANLAEPLSTEDIANLVGVSRRQLERLFKQHLDALPARWYLELRLQRARQLLLQSSQSILQVGLSCGFASGAHFSNAYRSFFGRTPRDERGVRAAAWRSERRVSGQESPEPAERRKEQT